MLSQAKVLENSLDSLTHSSGLKFFFLYKTWTQETLVDNKKFTYYLLTLI